MKSSVITEDKNPNESYLDIIERLKQRNSHHPSTLEQAFGEKKAKAVQRGAARQDYGNRRRLGNDY